MMLPVANIPCIVQYRGEAAHERFIFRKFNQRAPGQRNALADIHILAVILSVHHFDFFSQRLDFLRAFIVITKELINRYAKVMCNGRNHFYIWIPIICFPA